MATRTSVDFSKKIAPIFKRSANTYGVKNTCSLGAVLIHQLSSSEREYLMGMIADDTSLEDIEIYLAKRQERKAQIHAEAKKKRKKRIYSTDL